DDHAAHGSADARTDQTAGPLPLSELSKHDETMDQRTHGRRVARSRRQRQATIMKPLSLPHRSAKRAPRRRPSARSGSGSRAGFTLIELLIVISIIALMASLIIGLTRFVGVAKVRNRVTVERDQIVLAIESYHKKY